MTGGSEPLVSIMVPAFNSAATIGETLSSLTAQTYRNLEITVADNASTDGTREAVLAFAKADPRVKYTRHAENIGAEGNFSYCLRQGRGEYTAIFHADDVYSPTMVEEEVRALRAAPEAGAVFTTARSIDAAGRVTGVYSLPAGLRPGADGLYRFPEVFRAVLKYGNFFFCPSVMARTPIYRDVIRVWDAARYKTSADLDVWFRLLQASPIVILDKPLLNYRVSGASYSYHCARAKTGRADMFLVLDAYFSGAAAGLAGDAERKDYALLQFKDEINRAFNLVSQARSPEARPLLSRLFSAELTVHALKSRVHLKVLLYGWAVLLLSLFPMSERLRGRVFGLRHN